MPGVDRSLIDQSLSLFIPRVFLNITERRIESAFYLLGLGDVKRVDRVLKQDDNGNEYYSVYVHFERWYITHAVANFQEKVLNPEKEARIVYDDPWYWIVLENKAQKHIPGERKYTLAIDEPAKKSVSWAPQESWDLVDAAYAEYYEVQAAQDRAKVEHLEEELHLAYQALNAFRESNNFLSQEVQTLREELTRSWPRSIDIEESLKTVQV